MPRAFSMVVALSMLVMGGAVCVLGVRGEFGSHHASWSYYRYLPDRSVRSNEVRLGSDHRYVWLDITYGQVAPFDGQLVWGYHMNADSSGGRPRLEFHHQPHDALSLLLLRDAVKRTTASPVSWESNRRTKEAHGDDSYSLRLSITHWLLALLLFAPALWKLHRLRHTLITARRGVAAG